MDTSEPPARPKIRTTGQAMASQLGKDVVLVGKIERSAGTTLHLLSPDNRPVEVDARGLALDGPVVGRFVEACGVVAGPAKMVADSVRLLDEAITADFDQQTYCQALQLIEQRPEFYPLFSLVN